MRINLAADVSLFVRCRTAPNIQCKAELIRTNKRVCASLHGGKQPAGVMEGAAWGDEQNAFVYSLSAVCDPAEERKVGKKGHKVREMDR